MLAADLKVQGALLQVRSDKDPQFTLIEQGCLPAEKVSRAV
jgi:hypothetical protein